MESKESNALLTERVNEIGENKGDGQSLSGEKANRELEKLDEFLPENDACTPDVILLQLGGCGMYQFLLSFIIQAMKCVVCWGMIGNVFISYEPDWRCPNYTIGVQPVIAGNDTARMRSGIHGDDYMTSTPDQSVPYWNSQCYEKDSVPCSEFQFTDEIRTLVSEFDLVCDQSWVTATIVSIQMAGMCVGSILSGQLSDMFGRKRPLVSSMVILSMFHLISYFSVNWAMFAACRFFIGIGSAFFLTIYCTIQSEFTLSRWRSVVIGFPSWAIESSLFALVAWYFHDWKPLALIMSVMGLGFTASWFFIPESFRWYVVNDRLKGLDSLTKTIARWNKHPAPNQERIRKLLSKETEDASPPHCLIGLVDLFRIIPLLKLTLPLVVTWTTMGFVAYGINFGVKKLSGSIYMNIFLFSIASAPSKLGSIYLQNKFGRKIASVLAFALTGISGLIVGLVHNIDTPHRDVLITSFALVASVGVDGTWGPVQTLTVEVYPTIVRNVGFGFVSVLGRFGAVMGPQFVYLGEKVPGILYFAVALTCLLSVLCMFCLPETRNTNLLDRITENLEQHRKKEMTA